MQGYFSAIDPAALKSLSKIGAAIGIEPRKKGLADRLDRPQPVYYRVPLSAIASACYVPP